jgi:hypothetical protein
MKYCENCGGPLIGLEEEEKNCCWDCSIMRRRAHRSGFFTNLQKGV